MSFSLFHCRVGLPNGLIIRLGWRALWTAAMRWPEETKKYDGVYQMFLHRPLEMLSLGRIDPSLHITIANSATTSPSEYLHILPASQHQKLFSKSRRVLRAKAIVVISQIVIVGFLPFKHLAFYAGHRENMPWSPRLCLPGFSTSLDWQHTQSSSEWRFHGGLPTSSMLMRFSMIQHRNQAFWDPPHLKESHGPPPKRPPPLRRSIASTWSSPVGRRWTRPNLSLRHSSQSHSSHSWDLANSAWRKLREWCWTYKWTMMLTWSI